MKTHSATVISLSLVQYRLLTFICWKMKGRNGITLENKILFMLSRGALQYYKSVSAEFYNFQQCYKQRTLY